MYYVKYGNTARGGFNNMYIVKYSQDQFGFKLPSELIRNRTANFTAKLQASDSV